MQARPTKKNKKTQTFQETSCHVYTHARVLWSVALYPVLPTRSRVHTHTCVGYDVAIIQGRAICRYALHTYVPLPSIHPWDARPAII